MTILGQREPFTQEQILDLTLRLRSRWAWARGRAAYELADADFEQLERPPRLGLLLAALHAKALRGKAEESLARVLRGLDEDELAMLGGKERQTLRRLLSEPKPYLHSDFLIAVVHVLVRLEDMDSLSDLERLVERSTISQYVTRERRGYWTRGLNKEIVRSFEGTYDEEHSMRRVRSAANVACEQLRRLAEQPELGTTLLHPASSPESEELLRPATTFNSEPDRLLRPTSGSDSSID